MQEIEEQVSVTNPKFKIGDRVTRPRNVYNLTGRLLHGTVSRVYSRKNTKFGDYPELYDVIWDEADTKESGNGYLPHGLNKA